MQTQRTRSAQGLKPVILLPIVAVVGQTVYPRLTTLGVGNDSQGSRQREDDHGRMVSRAGAIEIPSEVARRPAGYSSGPRGGGYRFVQRVVSSPAVSSSPADSGLID